MTDRELMQQALEALEIESKGYADKVTRNRAIITALRERLAQQEPPCKTGAQCVGNKCQQCVVDEQQEQESTPIYLAEVTMPEPLAGGYIVDDCLWCGGAAWCLECRHEWIAVWPLAAESLECPACGSTDTDRDQAGPHKRKGEQHD